MPTIGQISASRAATKRADSDAGNDIPFEQAFSNLASAYLRDRAPGLLDYEVGFQLVDRDDAENKAVGITGFKVGSQWLYAPVFFLAGDLKGSELLYVKNQDRFVPLDQGWVDYLLSKKPVILGEGVNRDNRAMGVSNPDMFRALQPPRKYASARRGSKVAWSKGEREDLAKRAAAVAARFPAVSHLSDWAKVAVADLGRTATRPAGEFRQSLLEVVADGGYKAAACLADHFERWPVLGKGFDEFYDPAAVKAAFAKCAAKTTKVASRRKGSVLDRFDHVKSGKVRVYVREPGDFSPAPLLLERHEKEALFRTGLLVKDAREEDEVSHAYAVDVRTEFPVKLRNPTESGVYDVLLKSGDTEKCFVAISPVGPRRTMNWCTVVRMDGKKRAWINAHPHYVWVGDEYKGWAKTFDDLPDADKVTAGKTYYMAVSPAGRATVPFNPKTDLGKDAGGGTSYACEFDTYAERPRAGASPDGGLQDYDHSIDDFVPYGDECRIHLGQRSGSSLRSKAGDLYVPAGFKLLKLEPDAIVDAEDEDKEKKDAPQSGLDTPTKAEDKTIVEHEDAPTQWGVSEGGDDFVLGDALDVEIGIRRKTAALKVRFDGGTVHVNGVAMNRKRAVAHLVLDHGFRESTTDAVLARAEKLAAQRLSAEFRVKYADQYGPHPYAAGEGPGAPVPDDSQSYQTDDFMGAGVPTQAPFEQMRGVDDLRTDPANRDAYRLPNDDPNPVNVAQQAAQSGQKELFDTSMVGSLLKATDDDSMINKHIKKLEDSLDAKGQLLLTYFWRGQEMAERYGKDQMPELEDSLKDAFVGDGKLVLFLKRKTIEASPDEAARSTDLE